MLRALLGLAQNGTFNNPTFTGTVTGGLKLVAQSFVAVTMPNDVTEDTAATITIPAKQVGANGALIVAQHYTHSVGSGSVNYRIRYSGGAGTIVSSQAGSLAGEVSALIVLGNKNATNAQGTLILGALNIVPTILDAAIDTTAQTTIVLTTQKATGTDTVILKGYSVWALQ